MATSPDVLTDVAPATITDVPLDFSTSQVSDYGQQLIGLQDYSQVPFATNLNAPSLDSGLGVDPLTGETISPYIQDVSGTPSILTGQPVDASNGLNAVNPTLLPYVDPTNPTRGRLDPSMLPWDYTGNGSATTPSQSSGDTLLTDGNLPLTTPDKLNLTPLAVPVSNVNPLGSSIWAKIFGTANTAIGAKVSGVAAKPGVAQTPGLVKKAPHTAIQNPISNTTMFLVLGIVSALIGAVIWSFSGSK
jgi:hypothetical protein